MPSKPEKCDCKKISRKNNSVDLIAIYFHELDKRVSQLKEIAGKTKQTKSSTKRRKVFLVFDLVNISEFFL